MQQRMEEMRKQGPPPPSQFAMHLGDYKKVDGVMLPHKIDVSIEGQPNEEWTIEKFKVNPSVKASEFEKPKGLAGASCFLVPSWFRLGDGLDT